MYPQKRITNVLLVLSNIYFDGLINMLVRLRAQKNPKKLNSACGKRCCNFLGLFLISPTLLSYKVRWLEINFTLFRLKLLVLLNSLINKECRECQNYGRFPREQGNLNRFRLAQPCSIRTQLVLIITPVFCTHLWLNNFVYNECAKHLQNDSLLSTRKKKFDFISCLFFCLAIHSKKPGM